MTGVEGKRIGADPEYKWQHALDHDFRAKVLLAMESDGPPNTYFYHKGVRYFRHTSGALYRENGKADTNEKQ